MEQIRMALVDFTNECLKLTPEQFDRTRNHIGENTLRLLEGTPAGSTFARFLSQVENAVKSTGGGTVLD